MKYQTCLAVGIVLIYWLQLLGCKGDSIIRQGDTIAITGIVVNNVTGLWMAQWKEDMLDPALYKYWTKFKVVGITGPSINVAILDGDSVKLAITFDGTSMTNATCCCGVDKAKRIVCPNLDGNTNGTIPQLSLLRFMYKHAVVETTRRPFSDRAYIKMRAVNSSVDCNGSNGVMQCAKKAKRPADYGFVLYKVYK